MHAQIQIFREHECLACLYHRCVSSRSHSIWIIVDANICYEDYSKLRKDDPEMAFANPTYIYPNLNPQ